MVLAVAGGRSQARARTRVEATGAEAGHTHGKCLACLGAGSEQVAQPFVSAFTAVICLNNRASAATRAPKPRSSAPPSYR